MQNNLWPGRPTARAWRTKSEERNDAAVVHKTRAAVVHPKSPNSRNVTRTETRGDTFSGISARAVIKRNSQGRDKNRSVTAIAIRAQAPPRYPASPPMKAAIRVERNAAAGASRREIRVP